MKTLRIDEKWSIKYDDQNNDTPVNWLRYGAYHFDFDHAHTAVTAMFYALLEKSKEPEPVAEPQEEPPHMLATLKEQVEAQLRANYSNCSDEQIEDLFNGLTVPRLLEMLEYMFSK